MPFPNFHACRVKDPNLFQPKSFRTLHTKTKGLTFISGKLKSTGKSAVQSFRYDKKNWAPAKARKHCGEHDGSFEAAMKKILKTLMPSDIPNLLTPGGNTAFQGKGEKGLVYKLCIIENKERGKSDDEAKMICSIYRHVRPDIDLEGTEHYLDLSIGDKKFVYHRHWKDVEEYEARADEDSIGFDNTLLGEIKFSSGDHMMGYTIYLGKPEDNFPKDKLTTLKSKNKLEVSLNEKQSLDWLLTKDLSIRREIDENYESWSAYFIVDKGSYYQGVKRKHFQEFFLNGEDIKGRYIFIYAPVKRELIEDDLEKIFLEEVDNVDLEDRVWLVQKPNDQRPYAETHKLEDVIAELKTKKQKWLVWSSPSIDAEKIDIEKIDLKERKIDLFLER